MLISRSWRPTTCFQARRWSRRTADRCSRRPLVSPIGATGFRTPCHAIQHRIDQQDVHATGRRASWSPTESSRIRHARQVLSGLPSGDDGCRDYRAAPEPHRAWPTSSAQLHARQGSLSSNADYFRFVASCRRVRAGGATILQRLLHRARRDHRARLGMPVRALRGRPHLQAGRHDEYGLSADGRDRTPTSRSATRGVALDATLRSNVYMHGAAGSAAGGGYSTGDDLLAYRDCQAGAPTAEGRRDGHRRWRAGTSAVVESTALDGDRPDESRSPDRQSALASRSWRR